ncbi:MAG: hypothetical protein ABI216_21635 [Devosia sp.]
MIRRTLRRRINGWFAWIAHKRLARAVPGFAALDNREAAARRLHRSGARQSTLERKRLVTARLMQEIGRA